MATTKKVSKSLAETIEKMRERLAIEFGSDFAFVVLGNGEIIARSNVNGTEKAESK